MDAMAHDALVEFGIGPEQRADRVRKVLDTYGHGGSSLDTRVQDLVADLLHLLEVEGCTPGDVQQVHQQAVEHWLAER